MSKKNKKEFDLDEPYEASSSEFFRGKQQGLFETYEIVEQSITELKKSLDNVWTILNEADSYPLDTRSQDQKDKMAFAIHTLFVLRNIFEDKYYEKIEGVHRELEGWKDAF
jgi:hypothetical protein